MYASIGYIPIEFDTTLGFLGVLKDVSREKGRTVICQTVERAIRIYNEITEQNEIICEGLK